MEGWDATPEGLPSDLTTRRWENFGRSGAGLIWGGEAVAVQADGRANPNQLLLTDESAPAIGRLRQALLNAARQAGGAESDKPPVIGLQLTHSGRWSQGADGQPAPRIAYRHPLIDARCGVTSDAAVLTDAEVQGVIESFIRAALLAREEGFDFVDVKHCHGYLLHEFLGARQRVGRYGGASLQQRTAVLREIIAGIRAEAPGIEIGVRISAFDSVPFRKPASGASASGVPEPYETPYTHGFGIDSSDPTRPDLTEPIELIRMLAGLGVRMINVTGGSPYTCPHIQRPAYFPPSDGYAPPEDPLAGVARMLGAARRIKSAVPEAIVISTGWSYLQEYLPHVAQACLREGWFDAVGLGRMVLSYPTLPADVLAGRRIEAKRICRTFSDCTTAPRHGLASGCYPLDPFYRARPERKRLDEIKANLKSASL